MKNLSSLLKNLLTKNEFTFLHSSIKNFFNLEYIIKNQYEKNPHNFTTTYEKTMKEDCNGFKIDEKLLYIEKEFHNSFWNLLFQHSLIDLQNSMIFENSEILNDIKMVHHKSFINTCINDQVSNILENTTINKKNKYHNFLLILLEEEDTTFTIFLIESFLKGYVSQMKMKEKELNFTNISIRFGEMIVLNFINNKISSFQKYFDTLKKTGINLTQEEILALDNLIKIFTNNDYSEIEKFWASTENNKKFINNKDFMKIINDTITFQFMINDIPSLISQPHSKKDVNSLRNSCMETYLKIGSYFLCHFIEEIDDKTNNVTKPNLFQKKTYSDLQNKEITVLVPSSSLTSQTLYDLYNINKPYFTKSNINFMHTSKNPLIKLYFKNINNAIHKNANIHMTYSPNNFDNTPRTKLSIDEQALTACLDVLREAIDIVENDFKNGVDDILFVNGFIKALYRIDLNDFLGKINKTIKLILKTKDTDLLENICTTVGRIFVSFMFDFNTISIEETKNILEKKLLLNKKHTTLILNFAKKELYKIAQAKFFFAGFMSNAIKYAQFNYIYLDQYLDTRGRCYFNNIFLNPQALIYSRGILKLYSEKNMIMHVQDFKDVQKILKHDQSKNLITDLLSKNFNEKSLNKENERLIEYQLMDHLILENEEEKQELKNILEHKSKKTNKELFHYVISKIKKKKNILTIFSNIISEQQFKINPNKYTSTARLYHLDATTSGLQMQAMLFYDLPLASKSNLLGNENKDLYSEMCFNLKEKMPLIEKAMETIKNLCNQQLTWIWDNDINVRPPEEEIYVFSETFKNIESFSDLLKTFCQMNLESPVRTQMIYNVISEIKNNKIWQEALQEIQHIFHELSWMITSYEHKLLQMSFKSKDMEDAKKILLIRKLYQFYVIKNNYKNLDSDSPLWLDRDLFKRIVMTYFYGATPFGRKEDLKEFLYGKILQPDSIDYKTYKKDILFIATFINNFFESHMKSNISNHMQKLTQILVNKSKPVAINNDFFQIVLQPNKTKSVQITIPVYDSSFRQKQKQRSPQLRIKQQLNELDKEKLNSFTSPNIIHSMDACIVHTMNKLVKEINKNFIEKNKKARIFITHIHDTFIINNLILLKALLIECYWDLILSNYINNISSLTLEDKYYCLIGDITSECSKEFMIKRIEDKRTEFIKKFKNEGIGYYFMK